MDFSFILEALAVLFAGFCLLRILGKKTVGEMTGLEIITLLAMASVTGHAVSEDGLWKTIMTLCVFVALLILLQYLSIKFDLMEKLFMGKATLVIKDGKMITENMRKLRLSVDQLEAKLRSKGIASFTDVKTATIEMSGELGYELMKHAQPVTKAEMEKITDQLNLILKQHQQKSKDNLFHEVIHQGHNKHIAPELE